MTELYQESRPLESCVSRVNLGSCGRSVTEESDAHVERLFCRKPRKLKEICAVVNQVDAAQDLGAVDSDRDLGAAKVDAPETVPICASHFQLLLQAVGLDNGSQGALNVGLVGGECAQNTGGFFVATLANKPPGALRDPKQSRENDETPEPLQGKGYGVSPMISEPAGACTNAVAEELADDEAKIDITGENSADGQGTDL